MELNEIVTTFVPLAMEKIAIGWHQGSLAKDSNGDPATPESPDACSWCLTGAIWAVCDHKGAEYKVLMTHIRKVLGTDAVVFWNDQTGRTKEDVLKLLGKVLISV